MKFKSVVLPVLAACFCSSAVSAESIFNGEPFNGFYLGVQGGYGHAEDEVSDEFGLGLSLDLGSSGGTYGFLGGWGTTLPSVNPNLYVGIEGQYNKMERDGEISIGLIPASIEWETDDMWNIGGRLGYLLSDKTMIFSRLAYANLSSDVSVSPGGPVSVNVDDLDGIQVGFGFEHHLAHNFTLRGEYVYSDYGTAGIQVPGLVSGDIAEVDVSSSELRVALSYSFFQFPWQSGHSSGHHSPVSRDKTFDGFYVGFQGGFGHANDDTKGTLGIIGLTTDLGSSGPTFGFLGGWGTTLPSIHPNIYVGIESQYNRVNREGSISIGIIPAAVGWETDDMWNVGGRLGYLVGENTMVYTRAAYASMDSEISITPSVPIGVKVDDLDGIQLGLGIEHHIGGNFSFRGEYAYTDYGSADVSISGLGDLAEVDVTSSEFRAAVSYSFDFLQ